MTDNANEAVPSDLKSDLKSDEKDVGANMFKIASVSSSVRSECVVSSSHKNEAIFGSATYCLCRWGGIMFPVHIIFDSSVGVGEIRISNTVWCTLNGGHAKALSIDAIGLSIELEPIDRPPVADTVYVSIHMALNPEQSLLTNLSRESMMDIARLCLRYQTFNSTSRFAPTKWMSLRAHLSQADDEVAHVIGDITELLFETHIGAKLKDVNIFDELIVHVSSEFVGSSQLVEKLIRQVSNKLKQADDFLFAKIDANKASSVNRGAIITGSHGSGKTLLCSALCRAVGAVVGPFGQSDDYTCSVNLSRICEMERGVGESILINLPSRITKHTLLLIIDNIDVCCSVSPDELSLSHSDRSNSVLSISELTQMSCLIYAIDEILRKFPSCYIIGTSSRQPECLDKGLLLPNRLGSLIFNIQSLDTGERGLLLNMLLSKIKIEDDIGNHNREKQNNVDSFRQAMIREVAGRCQGLSGSDVLGVVQRALNGDTRTVSMASLVHEAMMATPSQLQLNSTSSDTLNLLKDVSMAPDLPGYEALIADLRNRTVDFFTNSQQTYVMFKKLGIRPSTGIIIQGASGTGKTGIAQLLGREASEHFRFLSVSCAELVHKVVGETEKKLSEIFSSARLMAPCFLLLDNLDVILGRSDPEDDLDEGSALCIEIGNAPNTLKSSKTKRASSLAFDRLLSTLLVEIDGIGAIPSSRVRRFGVDAESGPLIMQANRNSCNKFAQNEGVGGADRIGEEHTNEAPVIVIATTSDMGALDRALVRPGRLETHIKLDLPSEPERKLILEFLLKEKLSPDEPAVETIAELVEATEHRPHSFLKELVMNACMAAMRETMSSISETASVAAFHQEKKDFKIFLKRKHFTSVLWRADQAV